MSVYIKLQKIQSELKAPKNQENTFGGYKYRNLEDICEAVKPLLNKYSCSLVLSDDVVMIGERTYLKATATLIDSETGEKTSNNGFAREDVAKKRMDLSQLTGACSSYARKYALNGLFCIDDTKDADATNTGDEQKTPVRRSRRKVKVDETCPF